MVILFMIETHKVRASMLTGLVSSYVAVDSDKNSNELVRSNAM